MRSLLHYRDRHLIDPTDTTDLFWFEETVSAERLGLTSGNRLRNWSGSLRYWSGSSGWPNCGGLGFLYYAWISAVFDPVPVDPVCSFVCLNNNPRSHRLRLLDALWDRGLFDRGIVSWSSDSDAAWQDHVQAWLGEEQFPSNSLPVIAPPLAAWGQAAFSLVSETSVVEQDISEKTFQCISAGQPFVAYGCRGLHAWLVGLGFRLLPGVDYAFDLEEDPERRCELLTAEVQRLCAEDPRALRSRFQPVADRNRRHYVRLHRRLRLPFAVEDYDRVGPEAERQIQDLLDLQRRYLRYNSDRDLCR